MSEKWETMRSINRRALVYFTNGRGFDRRGRRKSPVALCRRIVHQHQRSGNSKPALFWFKVPCLVTSEFEPIIFPINHQYESLSNATVTSPKDRPPSRSCATYPSHLFQIVRYSYGTIFSMWSPLYKCRIQCPSVR